MATLHFKSESLGESDSLGEKSPTPKPPSKKTWSNFLVGSSRRNTEKNTAYRNANGVVPEYDRKIFAILSDFLQPYSQMTISSAATAVLDLLPSNAPLSTEVWVTGELVLELAEQIPYNHPSQVKLAKMMEQMRWSSKICHILDSKEREHGSIGGSFQRFGESIRENLGDPDVENVAEYINYQAFLTNLFNTSIWEYSPNYAVWAMRDAFEEDRRPGDDEAILRGAYVLGAAQWILWGGARLYQEIILPSYDLDDDLIRSWRHGPLYKAAGLLDIHRWLFWKDGFRAAAVDESLNADCKEVAAKAAEFMDALERSSLVSVD
ncbi:hypothetical protein VTK73DRAFT_1525 [Phialemonium thermophilum]|uniref:Uncharacterized protein n=1 Tax=Phialemonium thermophilum TaxID=223376 RepID=A0ABR3X909_9PEZI